MIKSQIFAVLRTIYKKSILCLPVKSRFAALVLLAMLAKPIHSLFLKYDPGQSHKYRLEQGLPLSLIWLLFPLRRAKLRPVVHVHPDQIQRLDALIQQNRGVLALGYHSLLMPFFNLFLLERYREVVSVGIRKTEFVFGSSFENRIQPEYMFLKKMHTALCLGKIVSVMVDTDQINKQTTMIPTRFGPLRISQAIFKMALSRGTPLIFGAPSVKGTRLHFEVEILEQPTDWENALKRYQHFLA